VGEQFEQLAKWDLAISKNIKLEEKKGLIVASGKRIKDRLSNRVKKEQENLRNFLFQMTTDIDRFILQQINNMKANLQKQPADLKSYVEFVT
jgi:hypothetical protein